MNKNITNISGVTLIEILMGVVISIVMMAAMFTSYNVVNNTYSKVTFESGHPESTVNFEC